MDAFSDPQAVARYAENPPRMVPGYADMQRMARLLLAERAPDDAKVLVLGAGGGLELKVFAEGHQDGRSSGSTRPRPCSTWPVGQWATSRTVRTFMRD